MNDLSAIAEAAAAHAASDSEGASALERASGSHFADARIWCSVAVIEKRGAGFSVPGVKMTLAEMAAAVQGWVDSGKGMGYRFHRYRPAVNVKDFCGASWSISRTRLHPDGRFIVAVGSGFLALVGGRWFERNMPEVFWERAAKRHPGKKVKAFFQLFPSDDEKEKTR